MSFWQILFGILVCAYAFDLEPVYKQTDADVHSFVQEYSEIGELINEYTGINTSSNFNYLMSETDNLHTYAIIFVIITVGLSLVTAIGSIGRKLDRRIIEGLAIFNTFTCCWITKSSTDLYELIVRDGVTLQTIAWIGRLLGTDIYSTLDLIIRSVWILPLILIIKHFYYHKTLNEYYALSILQSEPIRQQEGNSIQARESIIEEDIDKNNSKSEVQSQPKLTKIENTKQQSKPVCIWLIIGAIVIILITVIVVWKCTKDEDVIPVAQYEEINSTTGATQQKNTNINASKENKTNQFEYIKDERGNYKVDIEWPLSLTGVDDIRKIQRIIIQQAFFDENDNDIKNCVENYFKEGQEGKSLGEGETAGEVVVKFQQRFNSLYIFKVHIYADLGGGTGASIVYQDKYIYFDNNTERSLSINDMFTDLPRTLALVNEHISLDEYVKKTEELPNNFIISASGITFIFPKYSIGYGAQGEVEIALNYDELESVLSETFKRAIGR